jgi:hypothetical protein
VLSYPSCLLKGDGDVGNALVGRTDSSLGVGGIGFLLAAILSLGKLADEATERMQVVDVNGGYRR